MMFLSTVKGSGVVGDMRVRGGGDIVLGWPSGFRQRVKIPKKHFGPNCWRKVAVKWLIKSTDRILGVNLKFICVKWKYQKANSKLIRT